MGLKDINKRFESEKTNIKFYYYYYLFTMLSEDGGCLAAWSFLKIFLLVFYLTCHVIGLEFCFFQVII